MTNFSRRQFLRSTGRLGTIALSLAEARRLLAEPADTGPALPKSPFLEGNFAPVTEEISVESLKIVGQVPRELEGMFVRNGPNPQFTPPGQYHWFDGDGMLHGVRLAGGKASYRNRYVQSEGWKEERDSGKALFTGLADPIDLTRIAGGKPPFKNAGNTALVWHDGRMLALWEGGPPTEIRVPELETVGLYTYGGRLKHAFTAHPKVDPASGEMLFFGYSPLSSLVHYSIVDDSGELTSTTSIKLRRPVMMHDFAITENYTIFMDLPAEFQVDVAGGKGTTLRFNAERGARFGVVPRHSKNSQVRWFDSPSCFVFHTANAYEDGDDVILVACRAKEYPRALGLNGQDDAKAKAGSAIDALAASRTVLYRWRFNLKTGDAREEPLDDNAVELPRVDERRLGRATRFIYAMDTRMGRLVKHDLERGGSYFHPFGSGRLGGEPVFVPRSASAAEDDGWLLTYVFDAAEQQSELVIVAARNFTEPPVARVKIPARIPFGFHGTWLSADKLAPRAAQS